MNIEDVIDNVDVLSSDLESVSISSDEEESYYLDKYAKVNNKYMITKVNLNFYQIWTLFREMPCIYDGGKCKYEWKFRQKNTDVIFSIYDWNNNTRLLDTVKWYIGCNVNDEFVISKFLECLCNSIECYNKYYKVAVDTRCWQSDVPTVNDILQKMKVFLIENSDLLEVI